MNLAHLVRQARARGLLTEGERPSHADARFQGPGGYQYGIRHSDGSVRAYWSGASQLEKIMSEIDQLRRRWPRDTHTIVRRRDETDLWSVFVTDV